MLGEAEHLRQAEPGPLADLLGGEKRLKNASELRLRNSGAGILDRHRYIAPRVAGWRGGAGQSGGGAYANREPALAVHRVARVDGDVDHGGLELEGVGVDEAGFVRPMGGNFDTRADQRADHFGEDKDALADVEQLRLQGLPPRERQQLAGQSGSARHGVRDRVDVAQPPRLRQIRPPQQIDRRADHRKQIVEIMRNAAGELPQRFQPLAMSSASSASSRRSASA